MILDKFEIALRWLSAFATTESPSISLSPADVAYDVMELAVELNVICQCAFGTLTSLRWKKGTGFEARDGDVDCPAKTAKTRF